MGLAVFVSFTLMSFNVEDTKNTMLLEEELFATANTELVNTELRIYNGQVENGYQARCALRKIMMALTTSVIMEGDNIKVLNVQENIENEIAANMHSLDE